MLTPAELREIARRFRSKGEKESDIYLKRRLAGHALALAQLAEKVERQGKRGPEGQRPDPGNPTQEGTVMTMTTRRFAANKNIAQYQRLLVTALDDSARATIEQLLTEEKAELGAATAEEQVTTTTVPMETERVRRWRLKAEEYRATADISSSKAAKETYIRLAMDYEQLADQLERISVSKTRSQKSS